MLYDFDLMTLHFFNNFAGNSLSLDKIIFFISDNPLFEGGIFAVAIWILWFYKGKEKGIRPKMVLTLVGCFIAMLVTRILALTLPFRFRPIHNSLLNLHQPYAMSHKFLLDASSFPSDHAALFFALATGFYFINKKWGIIALCYAFFIICVPRIYLGLHYPSDILGGAAIGIATNIFMLKFSASHKISLPLLKWEESYPALFYTGLFLVTYQIADMFETTRAVISFTYSLVH